VRLSDRTVRFALKPTVFVASLTPLIYLGWAASSGNLSANPLSDLTNETGVWTLRFVCITLALTPLRKLTGWNGLIRFRRMAGLYAFFYGSLHLLTYAIADRFAGLDQAGDWVEAVAARRLPAAVLVASTAHAMVRAIGVDIDKRPFITLGFAGWLTLLPLAITSTAGWIRRLGGKRWNRLHRLVYVTGILGPLHYWWLVKADVSRPIAYAAAVAVLLSARIYWSRARRAAVRRVGSADGEGRREEYLSALRTYRPTTVAAVSRAPRRE
jgi:sulfoxide reductase heme-binding subunit YedZ